MPSAEHVRVIEGIAERFNSGRLDYLGDLLSPTLADFKKDLERFRRAFPDARFTIHDMVGEGDKVVDRYTISGTHEAAAFGIEATHRQVAVAGITIVRIEDGRVVERWGVIDQLSLLRQLGALPETLPGE